MSKSHVIVTNVTRRKTDGLYIRRMFLTFTETGSLVELKVSHGPGAALVRHGVALSPEIRATVTKLLSLLSQDHQ